MQTLYALASRFVSKKYRQPGLEGHLDKFRNVSSKCVACMNVFESHIVSHVNAWQPNQPFLIMQESGTNKSTVSPFMAC